MHSLKDDLKFLNEGFVGVRFIFMATPGDMHSDNAIKYNFEMLNDIKVGNFSHIG